MQTCSFDEAFAESMKYFDRDELASSVTVGKYLLRNKEDKIIEAGPAQIVDRATSELFRAESAYPNPMPRDSIFEVLDHFRFTIPQGSPLAGIGNSQQVVSIGNCFMVGSPHDSWGGICWKDQELAQIMKRRGGVGVDLSSLRPKFSPVENAARSSDGIECFAEKYSSTTKSVAQNGRRGALLISIDCRHPDVESFITMKRNKAKVTGANISVKWSDDFLRQVEKDGEYTLRFPVDAPVEKALVTRVVKARELWSKFVESAHAVADPGCLFWDSILRDSLSDCYEEFPTEGTNPCGEITLNPYGACLLMVVNLSAFVEGKFKEPRFNMELFKKHLRTTSRMMDDMVDLEIEKIRKIIAKVKNDPEPEEIKACELNLWNRVKTCYRKGRRTGLGVTGYGDMLAFMNLKYGSPEALKFTEEVMGAFHVTLMKSQAELAQERGPFPSWNWDKEKDCKYITMLPESVRDSIRKHGRRNISITTCSPAGTISLLTKTTSGIEPVFMRQYTRFTKMTADDEKNGMKPVRVDSDLIKWRSTDVVHHGYRAWLDMYPGVSPDKSPYAKCEAGEIDWKRRVDTQATIQKYITHSISSTVNLPEDATREEVDKIYMYAWKSGCKGITVYRDKCKDGVLVDSSRPNEIILATAPKRPKVLECDVHYSTIGENQWVFFVGMLKGKPYEIIGGKKSKVDIPAKYKTGWTIKNGRNSSGRRMYDLAFGESHERPDTFIKDIISEFNPDAGSYTRSVSGMLRHGMPIRFICDMLQKDSQAHMFTFEKGVVRVLSKYIKNGEQSCVVCDSCKVGKIIYKDGCRMCNNCGASYCS